MILHVDLNSFYASCAVAESGGKYRFDDKLMVCGSTEKRHGIVLAATYPVKRMGVHAGMATWEALQRCPGAVTVAPDYTLYLRYSDRFMDIVRDYTPSIMRYGIDEAYLDYAGCEHLFGPPPVCADTIRCRVKNELGLTVSVGVGDNLLMAKMGSDYKKPDAVTVITRENWRQLVWPLPVGDLMYVGSSTVRKLWAMGIKTVGQLAQVDYALLQARFGKPGEEMWKRANGIDRERVPESSQAQKEISNAMTLPKSARTLSAALNGLLAQADKVAYRLRSSGQYAALVGAHYRFDDLTYASRQTTLAAPTDLTEEIFHAVKELGRALYTGQPVRQVGVRVGRLSDTGEQLTLLDLEQRERQRRLDAASDAIRDRYGAYALLRASSLSYGEEEYGAYVPFIKS